MFHCSVYSTTIKLFSRSKYVHSNSSRILYFGLAAMKVWFRRQRIRSIDRHCSLCIKTRKNIEELLPHTLVILNWFCGIGRFMQSRPIILQRFTRLHAVLRCSTLRCLLSDPRYPAAQFTLFCSSKYTV